MIDINSIRSQFPILDQQVNGKPLVYFDNAATTQKPLKVIEGVDNYYRTINSNVHRGVHHLSGLATDAMEGARAKIQAHINAAKVEEVIFTKGVTDSINLVTGSLAKGQVKAGDEIIISHLEHHSNIVPWQMLCEQTGAILKVIPINDKGELELEAFKSLLNEKTKWLSVNHISNALGTINPIKEMIALAHGVGAKVLIDGAQAAPHLKIDVQDLDADVYVLSGHKLFGPTGIGILYGKEEFLNELPPYQGGGEMIAEVSFEKTTYAGLPHKFEAGTPNIAGAIGLGLAVDYVNEIGLENISAYEQELLEYATQELKANFPALRIYGEAEEKTSVVSFLIGNIHPYDLGVILDKLGVAMRTGHHCTQPIMQRFGIPGTLRASFAFYNTKSEIDQMIAALHKAVSMLS
ncbi:MAG: cysteine desulfurase/selenocysteine lyase [Roseivirga sp.]|jgi:cysteine desulfurase/selenocysteine lyase